jgi:hypothetical protein
MIILADLVSSARREKLKHVRQRLLFARFGV